MNDSITSTTTTELAMPDITTVVQTACEQFNVTVDDISLTYAPHKTFMSASGNARKALKYLVRELTDAQKEALLANYCDEVPEEVKDKLLASITHEMDAVLVAKAAQAKREERGTLAQVFYPTFGKNPAHNHPPTPPNNAA